jgi:DNA-binding transcriptional MerR regulator
MGINLIKMRALQEELNKSAKDEYKENLKNEVIAFANTDFFRNTFINSKSKIEIKQSSRVINSWEKEGLIVNEGTGKWKKYNRINAIWLEIVTQLREFGFSIEKIRIVKDQLFHSRIKKFIPIEYGVMYSVIQAPMILLVHLDGKINLMPKSTYSKNILNSRMSPYIYFDFESFVRKEFPNNSFDSIGQVNGSNELSDDELQLLYFIRSGDFESIKIKTNNGEVLLIEIEEKIDVSQKIIDIIKKGAFQDIQIKTQNGKIVSIKATEKIKKR